LMKSILIKLWILLHFALRHLLLFFTTVAR